MVRTFYFILLLFVRYFSSLTFTLIDDVLRARLKTVGISEYKFEMEASAGKESGNEWSIYDVGGTRSQVRTFGLLSTDY